MLIMSISCSNDAKRVMHHGDILLSKKITMLDSVLIDVGDASGRGNFFMQDSSLYFADSYYMSVFQYDFDSATCVGRYFNRGQGPNELSSFLYVYPFKGSDEECFLLDGSLRMYTYRKGQYSLGYKGHINFGWGNLSRNNYASPSVYNVMEMTDFGIDFTYVNDSTILFPVNLVNRYLNGISKKRYEQGHIFAELDSRTMQVRKVFGRFPEIYEERPTPFFEFFQYALNADTLYVNHATDSLIYVYKYPDELLYTIGYETAGVNRNYTVGYDVDISNFKSDIRAVGVNSGLLYIPEKHLLLRTTLKQLSGWKVCLQAYANNNLILDEDMPDAFKLLGFWNGCFYGVKMIPNEDMAGNMSFVFYRFKIDDAV